MTPEEREERKQEHPLRLHSDEAWRIANLYSHVLASETRDLAAWIDKTRGDARNEALEEAAATADLVAEAYEGLEPSIGADRAAAHIRNLKSEGNGE